MRRLRAQGVDILVSALTPEEVKELDLSREPDYCRENGINFRAFPIPDRDIPSSYGAVTALANELGGEVLRGRAVVIHCRAGIGRSSLLAACALVVMGISADRAFELIREARGCNVPDTPLQRAWVEEFARLNAVSVPHT